MVANSALDSKVSFCSRMKPLVKNMLRLNTEEGHRLTELEAFGRLLEQRMPLTDRITDRQTHATECCACAEGKI